MKTKDKFLAFFLFCIAIFIAGFGMGTQFPQLNTTKMDLVLVVLMNTFAISSLYIVVKKSED